MKRQSFKYNKIMKHTPFPYILIALGIMIGLFLTAQWKVPPVRNVNPIAPYLALRDTRNDLADEQANLKQEISNLQKNIDQENSVKNKDSESINLINQSQRLKDKAGLTKKSGSGLVMTLNDASSGPGTIDNITHAADLRDIVNVLWQNGAEAISINGERVVMNTSIDCIVNTILINNTKTTPPFTILAAGDSYKLEKGLRDSASLNDLWKRVKNAGLVFEIKSSWKVDIQPFNGSFVLHFAQKASSK